MKESVFKTLTVAFTVCLVCSLVVSYTAVGLRDLQNANKLNDERMKILQSANMYDPLLSVESQFNNLEMKYVDFNSGTVLDSYMNFNIEEYDDMVKISAAEQHRIVKECGWTSKVIPRTVTALSVFISISKFMKNKEWEDYFSDAVYEILSRDTGLNPNMKKDSNLIETTIMSNT